MASSSVAAIFQDPKNNPAQKEKKIPTCVYFFSISLSLLSLSFLFLSFRDTKFWFLFSNAIIFFVAGDSDAFSTPKPDLYDEFLKHRSDRSSSTAANYNWVITTSAQNSQQEISTGTARREKKLQMNEKADEEAPKQVANDEKAAVVAVKEGNNVVSTENKDMVAVEEENVGRDHDHDDDQVSCEDEDDCSELSDEELNRRVEEFIRRVNREIRLQQIRERQAAIREQPS
ncbi:hypothetical protein H6P81_019510 [Aristolochia fimbriata]|uniref:Uncharacterized protein n=1 Tax=Aristolochia fimbriata TaxID=158543 RepID=A0AAV7DTH1_ARIFI|nr:hypothetical protein H6P81_019510 [Aristolochia fimbriata]